MSRDRVLLVGEDFGRSPVEYHTDAAALTGASGRHLARLVGYQGPNEMLLYMLDFERTNVVVAPEEWRDRALVARRVAEVSRRMTGRRTILLGSRVAAAFDAESLPLLEWVPLVDDPGHVARVPHPSGRSRWWNDADNTEAARRFLRASVAGSGPVASYSMMRT